MTTGARLVALSGQSGLSAGAHLRLLAGGTTAGEILVARSGLLTGSAMDHLIAEDRVPGLDPRFVLPALRRRKKRRQDIADEDALFALGLL